MDAVQADPSQYRAHITRLEELMAGKLTSFDLKALPERQLERFPDSMAETVL
jgi:hypothetical protein